jgi:hypothetical protein
VPKRDAEVFEVLIGQIRQSFGVDFAVAESRFWDRAFAPTIQAHGYEPVRADQDTGALIITQMIERLYFADLVLVDMTIPNGNVYYEVGVRHAAKEKGCVLSVSVREDIESAESFVIQERRTDSLRSRLACGRAETGPATTAAACVIPAI